MREANGYVALAPETGTQLGRAEIVAALESAGWRPWSGDGIPSLVVFHVVSSKGDYFEAGVWAGAGVPVFFLGGGSRYSRKAAVNRFGGWTVVGDDNRADAADLLAAIARRALVPQEE